MLKKAGTGIGYFGKPAVVEATPHQIRHTDLRECCFLCRGISKERWLKLYRLAAGALV